MDDQTRFLLIMERNVAAGMASRERSEAMASNLPDIQTLHAENARRWYIAFRVLRDMVNEGE